MSKRIIFISDLHLDPSTPSIIQEFSSLLKCLTSHDELYILGDFFEQWIGDDDDTSFVARIMHLLLEAKANGINIFIMRGNRDFLLSGEFAKKSGCTLLPDEVVINAFGTKILLMHGDTLCTRDVGYQIFRKLTRNTIFSKLYTSLPLASRFYLANLARKQSKKATQKKSDFMMDVAETAVFKAMRKHAVTYLIHGHTHLPNTHHHHVGTNTYTRIVLAAWHEKGSAYVWEEDKQGMRPIDYLAP